VTKNLTASLHNPELNLNKSAPEGADLTSGERHSDVDQTEQQSSECSDPGCSAASTHVHLHPSRPPLVLPPDLGEQPVVLAFSGGKDSLATACALSEAGIDFQALFYDWLPGSHITSAIHQYEPLVGKIHVLTHPCVAQRLNNGVWESRETRKIVSKANFAEYGYEGARSDKYFGQWCAIGVRAADSPSRRLAVGRGSAIQRNKKTFWPIAHWKIADVRSILDEYDVKLPVDYELFGRSFDGLGARYTAYLDEHDRRLMDAVFPFWRADVARRIYAQKK
jgi:hypothetical protein